MISKQKCEGKTMNPKVTLVLLILLLLLLLLNLKMNLLLCPDKFLIAPPPRFRACNVRFTHDLILSWITGKVESQLNMEEGSGVRSEKYPKMKKSESEKRY
jgi:hypothetical protein